MTYEISKQHKGELMKTILVPIATGFEEIEAVNLIDVLRRADIKVIVASVNDRLEVQGANGIVIKADQTLANITSDMLDMILLPGGWGGTDILAQDETVQALLKDMDKKNKDIAAICAAPYALHEAGVLKENFTCYPSAEEKIRTQGYIANKKVVEDQNVITSRGPGTAICLALYIVKKYKGNEMYEQLKAGLLADYCE
jgi:4-methyl-5(b-hydroxyethyl)-thiazole monophosphate biosynthesis